MKSRWGKFVRFRIIFKDIKSTKIKHSFCLGLSSHHTMSFAQNKISLFRRIASYRSLPLIGEDFYCTKLAERGYIYTGHELDIECEACKAKTRISDSWRETEKYLRHERGCEFQSSTFIDDPEQTQFLIPSSSTSSKTRSDSSIKHDDVTSIKKMITSYASCIKSFILTNDLNSAKSLVFLASSGNPFHALMALGKKEHLYRLVLFYPGGSSNQPSLTKLSAQEQVYIQNIYRKVLLYATDTCPGSCGAPILTFFSRPPDVNNIIIYKLDLWTHTGVETTHKLGVSELKVCTLDDIYQHRPEGAQGGRLSITEEDSEDEDSLGKQKVNSPVYKVLNAPCHPEYSLFHIRFDSYAKWTYMPSPYSLASNGFFYTGETDCVRCFQCGLGLRSWKRGDDVFTQHEKFRPTCPFLMSLAKRRLSASTEAIAIADLGISSTGDKEVQLLELENRTLKQRLMCKICYKSEIKDVFLPCGELYACNECSKLLTHCPSCKKQILATVTIYLT